MKFSIRPPQAADESELVQLHIRCWQQTYAHLVPTGFFDEKFRAQRTGQWHAQLNTPAPGQRLAVAESDGTLVGFATAAPSTLMKLGVPPARKLALYSLYVLAEHHGTGLGQALLDAVLAQDPAQLWVEQSNARAIAFYRRNGFELDGQRLPDPTLEAVVDLRMVR